MNSPESNIPEKAGAPELSHPVAPHWKAIGSAAVVLCLAGALYGGLSYRNRLDFQNPATPPSLDGLTASLIDSKEIPLVTYYDKVVELLKDNYVDPITDDQKLAVGAVRGMVTSLGDAHSLYLSPTQFSAYNEALQGRYTGIGADLVLDYSVAPKARNLAAIANPDAADDASAPTRLPRLVVASVVKDGPAGKAGVQPGDWVDSIDGHWVVEPSILAELQTLATAAPTSASAKTKFEQLRRGIRQRVDKSIMPWKAVDRVAEGTSGQASIVWHRGGVLRTTLLKLAASHAVPSEVEPNGTIRLSLLGGAKAFLARAIEGKPEVTIDLRNDAIGDMSAMQECLSVLVPSGTYGGFTNLRGSAPTPLSIENGNPHPPKIKLIVDESTRGPAQILALALSSRHFATLSGREMPDDRAKTVLQGLPDGSGYLIKTGEYKPILARTKGAGKL